MILAGVAILAAIGLGVWALNVNSDLNDAEAQVAAQTEAATAAASELEQISSDNEIYVVSNEDVAQAESDVAAAEKAVADANAAAAAASANVSSAQAELEQARAERQQARICARGSLGVLSKPGASESEAAASELETVSSACTASVSG